MILVQKMSKWFILNLSFIEGEISIKSKTYSNGNTEKFVIKYIILRLFMAERIICIQLRI
jgi:hypothetical protein